LPEIASFSCACCGVVGLSVHDHRIRFMHQ
jgi:hypothetical protein